MWAFLQLWEITQLRCVCCMLHFQSIRHSHDDVIFWGIIEAIIIDLYCYKIVEKMSWFPVIVQLHLFMSSQHSDDASPAFQFVMMVLLFPCRSTQLPARECQHVKQKSCYAYLHIWRRREFVPSRKILPVCLWAVNGQETQQKIPYWDAQVNNSWGVTLRRGRKCPKRSKEGGREGKDEGKEKEEKKGGEGRLHGGWVREQEGWGGNETERIVP